MLQSPYKQLLTIGDNRYYLLELGNEDYLATESTFKYMTIVRRKPAEEEMTQGVTLLELSHAIRLTFLALMNAKLVNSQKTPDGILNTFEVEDIKVIQDSIKSKFKEALEAKIAIVTEQNKDKSKEELKAILKKEREGYIATKFSFDLEETEPDVIKAMIQDGNEFLCKEQRGSRTYDMFLINRSTTGDFKIIKILVVETKTKRVPISFTTYVFNRNIVQRYFETKEKQYKKVEKKEEK